MKRNPKRESGFTLLELLVALSLTALIMAAVAASFMGYIRAQERAELAMEKMRSLEFAMVRLRETIGTTYIPLQVTARQAQQQQQSNPQAFSQIAASAQTYVFEGQDLERPNEPFDALTFTSIGHRVQRLDAKQSELAEMTVFAAEDHSLEDGDRCRILKIREGGSINDRFEVEGGMVYDLAYNISRFQILYLTPEGDLKQEWKLMDTGGYLPCAAVIHLGAGCGEAEQDQCLLVPLKMTNALKCEFEQDQLRNICDLQKF